MEAEENGKDPMGNLASGGGASMVDPMGNLASGGGDPAQVSASIDDEWIQVVPRKRRPWRNLQGFRGDSSSRVDHGPRSNWKLPPFNQNDQRFRNNNSYQNDLGTGIKEQGQKQFQSGGAVNNKIIRANWRFQTGGAPTSWKDVCTMGRDIKDDCALEFFAPLSDDKGNQFAAIPRSVILENVNKWNNTLVGYVLGDKPFYSHL